MLGLCACVIAGAVLVVVAVAVAAVVVVVVAVVAEAYGILLRHFWVSCIPRKAGKISCFGYLLLAYRLLVFSLCWSP